MFTNHNPQTEFIPEEKKGNTSDLKHIEGEKEGALKDAFIAGGNVKTAQDNILLTLSGFDEFEQNKILFAVVNVIQSIRQDAIKELNQRSAQIKESLDILNKGN